MSENKVTFGLERVHIAFVDDAATKQPAWKPPVAIPGAVRWTPEAVGESTTFYADNGPYFTITANNGYTGELEMANIPDAITAEMLGWKIDSNGMLVEVANAMPKNFALLGQVQGDKRARRFVYYDCQGTRPAKERTTKSETIEPTTDVISLTVSPITIDGETLVKGDLERSDTNATVFNSFFDSIYIPTFTPEAP